MISKEDQVDLFKLISRYLKKDILCWAFGGTAMMFYGYKTSTKDIDLIFDSAEDRDVFIDALLNLGYSKKSLSGVYNEEQIKEKNAPIMYSRGDERFDLFVGRVFAVKLSEEMKKRFYARHDFADGRSLIINVMSKEDIILMKSMTERERDFEDIEAICKIDKIDWSIIIDEAIRQKNDFIILDLEKTMQNLKKSFLIKKEYFDRLHKAL